MDSNAREKARIAGFIEVTPTTPSAGFVLIKVDKIKTISIDSRDGMSFTIVALVGQRNEYDDDWIVTESVGEIMSRIAAVGRAP